jgi:adenylosuccinate synthase
VLSHFPTINVCTGYRYRSQRLKGFPVDPQTLNAVEPEYTELPGWQTSLADATTFDELPPNARALVDLIESYCQVPVTLVSTGAGREQIVRRQ